MKTKIAVLFIGLMALFTGPSAVAQTHGDQIPPTFIHYHDAADNEWKDFETATSDRKRFEFTTAFGDPLVAEINVNGTNHTVLTSGLNIQPNVGKDGQGNFNTILLYHDAGPAPAAPLVLHRKQVFKFVNRKEF